MSLWLGMSIGVALLWLLARRFWRAAHRLDCRLALRHQSPGRFSSAAKSGRRKLHTPIILFGLLLLLYGFQESRAERPRSRSVALAQCLSLPVLLFAITVPFRRRSLTNSDTRRCLDGAGTDSFSRLHRWADLIADSRLTLLQSVSGETLAVDPARVSDALERSAARGPDSELGLNQLPSRGSHRALAWNPGWRLIRRPSSRLAYPPFHGLSLALLPVRCSSASARLFRRVATIHRSFFRFGLFCRV